MDGENKNAAPTFRGSEQEVLERLLELSDSEADLSAVCLAIQHVDEGHRFIECAGSVFEVIDPEWSVVQDVYGCAEGRDCPDVSKRQRRRLDQIVRARMDAAE